MTVLLIRYAEIGLKSAPVRARFENRLRDNIIDMLAADGVEAIVTKGQARFYVESDDLGRAATSVGRVFGVASYSLAETCGPDMESIVAKAAEYSRDRMEKGKTFAVKARREGQQKFTSMDIGRNAGDAIWNANLDKDPKVDLKNPDVTFHIEARPKAAYIFSSYVRCHGGLPVGSQGRVVARIDGDRGVLSAWLMMKRGCRVYCRGDGDLDLLRAYDPGLKAIDDGDRVDKNLGYVLGCGIGDIEGFDASAYDLPVYFPTVGMSDEEVASRLRAIREEAARRGPSAMVRTSRIPMCQHRSFAMSELLPGPRGAPPLGGQEGRVRVRLHGHPELRRRGEGQLPRLEIFPGVDVRHPNHAARVVGLPLGPGYGVDLLAGVAVGNHRPGARGLLGVLGQQGQRRELDGVDERGDDLDRGPAREGVVQRLEDHGVRPVAVVRDRRHVDEGDLLRRELPLPRAAVAHRRTQLLGHDGGLDGRLPDVRDPSEAVPAQHPVASGVRPVHGAHPAPLRGHQEGGGDGAPARLRHEGALRNGRGAVDRHRGVSHPDQL